MYGKLPPFPTTTRRMDSAPDAAGNAGAFSAEQAAGGALLPRRDHSFTDQNVVATDALFMNCQFSRCRLVGPVSEASFSNCVFDSVIFVGPCEDCTFDACRLRDVRFVDACSDCTWTHCTFVAARGAWAALRCVFVDCTLRRAQYRKRSSWAQCRFADSTFDRCILDTARFTDCHANKVTWRQCSMARAVVSRCVFVACTTTATNTASAAFAGNVWRQCAWRDCNGDFSSHVAEAYADTTCVRRTTANARWARCRFVRDRHDHAGWYRTRWTNNHHVDSTWRTVKMHCSVVDGARYTNVDVADLDDHDTAYTNVRRTRQPYVICTLHFHDGTAPKATTTELFAQHRRVKMAVSPRFRLRPSSADEVDFVYVKPTPGWFTFGFSQPLDAHHLVSHVTCGRRVFYPSKDAYLSVRTGVDMLGYRCGGRRRAGSL